MNGVQQLLLEGLELDVVMLAVPRRLGVRHRLRLRFRKKRVGGAEHRADADHRRRHRAAAPSLRERRKRLLAARREAELLERHRRQVQHARAARLLLAVDVVHVLVRPVGDALVRLREHLVARAEAQRVGRARLHAGGDRHGVGELLAASSASAPGRCATGGGWSARSAQWVHFGSSARASPTPRSARPRGRPACSSGSRCTRRRRRRPARRSGAAAPWSGRPRRRPAPGSAGTAASMKADSSPPGFVGVLASRGT